MWCLKLFFIATLTIGVFAEYQISNEHRNQFKQLVTNYCKKNGAEDKVEEVETSLENFVDCVKGLFDVETVKQEIEEAKPNGALDEVFKKYCAKSPQLKTCIHALGVGISPCLDKNIRNKMNGTDSATDQLIDFVCHKDGDRIALFIAEGGPECFQEKASKLQECGTKLQEGVKSFEDAKKLTVDEQCAKYDSLSTCIVSALEECSTPTPGNMAESLLRYIRKSSPCK